MDSSKDHIEAFFNESMKQFSELPSDRVWTSVVERLDAELVPFYKNLSFWKAIFGLQTVTLLIVSAVFLLKPSTEDLNLKMAKIEEENHRLKTTLDSLQKHELSDKAQMFSAAVENSDEKLSSDTLAIIPAANNNQTASLPVIRKPKLKSEGDTNRKTDLEQAHIKKLVVNFRLSKNAESELADERPIFKAPQLLKIVNKIDSADVRKPLSTFLNGKFKLPKLMIPRINIKLLEKLEGDFSLGITGSTLLTFTDQNDHTVPSFNEGLITEWPISKGLHLTVGVRHNSLRYSINLAGSDAGLLQQYPLTDDLPFPARRIQQRVQFFDIPVGLKWFPGQAFSDKSIFIEPSIAFQYHLRQKFSYLLNGPFGLSDFNIGLRTRQRFYGMAQLQVGFEKNLIPHWDLQLGLLGQLGLSKFGFERRNIYALGIQAGILFKP